MSRSASHRTVQLPTTATNATRGVAAICVVKYPSYEDAGLLRQNGPHEVTCGTARLPGCGRGEVGLVLSRRRTDPLPCLCGFRIDSPAPRASSACGCDHVC